MLNTAHNWVNEFKNGSTFTKDEHRSGCPVERTTSEIDDKIRAVFCSD